METYKVLRIEFCWFDGKNRESKAVELICSIEDSTVSINKINSSKGVVFDFEEWDAIVKFIEEQRKEIQDATPDS